MSLFVGYSMMLSVGRLHEYNNRQTVNCKVIIVKCTNPLDIFLGGPQNYNMGGETKHNLITVGKIHSVLSSPTGFFTPQNVTTVPTMHIENTDPPPPKKIGWDFNTDSKSGLLGDNHSGLKN
jgi:hypothetical protein